MNSVTSKTTLKETECANKKVEKEKKEADVENQKKTVSELKDRVCVLYSYISV